MNASIRSAIRFSAGMALAAVPAFSFEPGVEIRGLLDVLAAEAFQERAAAEEKLRGWAEGQGEPGKDWLAAAMERSTDPEVRKRLRQVLREIVVRDEIAAGPGYVGIQMASVDLVLPGGKGANGAVSVLFVVPGTPGERAGLQAGDTIVSLDGRKWDVLQGMESFRTGIAARKPGTKVRLGVLRGQKIEPIEVELAPKPLVLPEPVLAGMFGVRPVPFDAEAEEEKAREELFRAWMEKRRLRPAAKKR